MLTTRWRLGLSGDAMGYHSAIKQANRGPILGQPSVCLSCGRTAPSTAQLELQYMYITTSLSYSCACAASSVPSRRTAAPPHRHIRLLYSTHYSTSPLNPLTRESTTSCLAEGLPLGIEVHVPRYKIILCSNRDLKCAPSGQTLN